MYIFSQAELPLLEDLLFVGKGFVLFAKGDYVNLHLGPLDPNMNIFQCHTRISYSTSWDNLLKTSNLFLFDNHFLHSHMTCTFDYTMIL